MTDSQEHKPVVIVLGGYGNFGKRICDQLARNLDVTIIIAGRSANKAKQLKAELLQHHPETTVKTLVLDRVADDFLEQLKAVKADILIHTAGPFQGQSYYVAKACIAAKIHYVDIADAREYVSNIETLNDEAVKNNIVVISGASSVPGLSSTVIEHYAPIFSNMLDIDFGISPGNQVERGLGTLQSVFDYVGKPFEQLERAQWHTVYGWQQMHRQYFGDNVGVRWLSCCNVPDMSILPKKYPKLRSVKFYAGLELGFLHSILWSFSWLVRWKLIKNLSKFSKPILKISDYFSRFGSPTGGMYMRIHGTDKSIQPHEVEWHLVAESAHGLNIPIIPALIVTRKILKEQIMPGAQPCYNLFSLEEFDAIASQWHIYHTMQEQQM